MTSARLRLRLEMTLTDERTTGAETGADDATTPPRLDDALPAEPAALSLVNPYDVEATDDVSSDTPPADAEPVEGGRARPPLAVIAVATLLLVAIGAGLAFLVPSGPVREVDQLIPTAPAGAAGATGAPGATGEVPTALPLAQAVEGDSGDVIAEVGDGTILRGDFARLYQPGSSADELLDQLIQLELVVQAAADEGVEIDEAAVTEQVDQIRTAQAGGDQAAFEEFLAQNQIDGEEDLRRLLARDQIVEQMILRHTTGEQVHARHILIATESVSETEQARVQAEELMTQLEGGADFAALASEHSADTGSAMNGGDLGWALKGMYVPEFDEAVFSMEPGERRLVQTQFGYHIIEVVEPAVVQGLQSSDLLQTGPGQQAFAETFIPWVDGLKAAADEAQSIKILIPAEELVAVPAQ
jgi:peptidyl-prolyl cis-trans isomerase C